MASSAFFTLKLVSKDQNSSSSKLGTSDLSESSQITLSSILQKQLANDSWVQCDNPHCKKWRRVDEDELESIGEDDQWFCRMNLDLEHNSCSHTEENYKLYDKLIKTVGLYYIMSALPEGSLVWAKMNGYCKWPALISKDPSTGYSVDVDECERPTSYHVEYLGRTRSHGWLPLKAVSEYMDTTTNEKQEQKLVHRKRKLKYGIQTNCKRKFYRNKAVEVAIEEANSLLSDSPEKRLGVIKYTYKAVVKEEVDNESKDTVQLAEGTLVCAKMPGYSKWPAMITPDPVTGYSVDDDDSPLSYHVEFLGKTHGHGWVDLKCINIYKDRSSMDGYFGDGKLPLCVKNSKGKRDFMDVSVTEAIAEAESLLRVSADKRLEVRQFTCTDHHRARVQERLLKGEADKTRTAQNRESIKRPKVEMDKGVLQNKQSGPGLFEGATNRNRIPATGSAVRNKPASVSKPTIKHEHDCPLAMTSPTVGESRSLKAHNSQTEPVLSPRMVNTSDLTFNTSLLNKSKEEKFTMDIQMYKKNGQAFLHDVYRFMNRHGLVFRSSPCWHNTAVIVFDLFLSVHERGGYQKVCQKHQWNSVYYELIQHTDNWGGAIAKKYYYRYLYAYEVYIERGNYREVVEIIKQEPHNKEPKKAKQKAADRVVPITEKVIMIGTEDDIDFTSILLGIEQTNSKEELGIDVTFFDESTPEVKSQDVLSANTASEFEIANQPESSAQQVPSFDFSSEDSSGQGEAILHEMQAIQDEMDAMTEELSAR